MRKTNLFIIGLLTSFLTMSTWAADSTTVKPLGSAQPAATFLWATGVLPGQYIRAPTLVPLPGVKNCPQGLTPSYNVAVREGYIAPVDKNDPGIRGIHLVAYNLSFINNTMYLTLDEAYTDTIAKSDTPIDVSYWIYCGPPSS